MKTIQVFEVGDTVIVSRNCVEEHEEHCFEAGTVGVVMQVSLRDIGEDSQPYKVQAKDTDMTQYICGRDLQLLNSI